MSRPDPRSDQTLELRRKIAQARQEFQAAKLGQSEAFPREEMRLVENVASMLAQAELKLMMGLQSQATPRHPIRATSTTIDSSSTSNSTSNPISVSITNSPQGHFTTELLNDMSTQAGLQPPYILHSTLVVPSGPAFAPLFKLWGGQLGTTPPEVPILNGIQLDLSILALQINALGGKVEIRHNPNQWKRLAFQHALSKDRNQDDEQSRDAANLLQKTYEEILLPFEEFYIKWQQLPIDEKKRQIPVMSTPLKYISISIRHPAEGTGDSLEPAPTDQVSMLLAQNPVEAGSRMAEIYFQHFYPGIILYTKISRLLNMSRSDLSRYQWADERIEWMLQLQRRSEGQDIADVITYMTDLFSASVSQQLQMARSREVATPDVATTQVPATTPVQKAPIRMAADCDMAAMPPPATKHVIFSTELVEHANTFVEETLAKIEDVRTLQKRIEVPGSERKQIESVVAEGYDLALFFYRTVALHYMLFMDKKTTQTLLMQAIMMLEQSFFSSAGSPVHVMRLEYAKSIVISLRQQIELMQKVYAAKCREHLKLKARNIPGNANNNS